MVTRSFYGPGAVVQNCRLRRRGARCTPSVLRSRRLHLPTGRRHQPALNHYIACKRTAEYMLLDIYYSTTVGAPCPPPPAGATSRLQTIMQPINTLFRFPLHRPAPPAGSKSSPRCWGGTTCPTCWRLWRRAWRWACRSRPSLRVSRRWRSFPVSNALFDAFEVCIGDPNRTGRFVPAQVMAAMANTHPVV